MTLSTRLTIILAVFVAVVLPLSATGAEVDLRSGTFLHLYQAEQPAGGDTDYAPLYEHLSLDLTDIGRPGLSFHFYGAGRFDLGEETGTDSTASTLSSAYARYRYADGRGHLKLGRFFLTEGVFVEALDGIYVKQSLGMIGISLFGGNPNSDSDSEDIRGNLFFGVRTFFLSPGRLELGLNYLSEDGGFGDEEREEAGSDIWFHPTHALTLTGRAQYNLTNSNLASDYLSLHIRVTPSTELILDTTGYRYEDLFQATTNPVFAGTLLNPDDEVRVISGTVQWSPGGRIDLSGTYSTTNHSEDDPGDIHRSEFGMAISFSSYLKKIGLRTAIQKSDQVENGFNELRSFAMLTSGPFSFSLDAMALLYEEEISGEDQTNRRSCHGRPPSTGEHGEHSGAPCEACHPGAGSGSGLNHFYDNEADVEFSVSNFTYFSGRCTGTCHIGAETENHSNEEW